MTEVLLFLTVVAAAVVSLFQWRDIIALTNVDVTGSDNDDEKAQTAFLDLLGEAREEMIVHDDGGPNEGSIYESDQVVEALKEKLDSHPKFEMKCLFSNPTPTKFTEHFRDHPRVRIVVRDKRSSMHYKIIDDGRKAYVSSHKSGSSERNFKFIDCSDTLGSKYARDAALGDYLRDFDNHAS